MLGDGIACHPTIGSILPDGNEQIIYGVAQANELKVGLQSEMRVRIGSQRISEKQDGFRGTVEGLDLSPF